MHPFRTLLLSLPLLAAWPLQAQDLAATCHATSSYDLTVEPDSLLFDRANPAPRRVLMQGAALRVDGRAVALNDEAQDRLTLFERDLRALLPRVKAVADRGVDMAVAAVQAEAAGLDLGADTRAELDRRLAAHAAELKRRIAASRSTHDWHGTAAEQYAQGIATDLMPLVAADLGQQALAAAMSGDLQTAAALRERASALATDWPARLQARMQGLRPQVQALCPDIQRLAELQQGLRDGAGRPLELLQARP
ncbi:DUF2884 family protein [Fulvimonas sp. R45]|uniref:DUF2884 family protein n=1 Tax=Fulvimonas sp. R45 TaxID=3045937 RepID=UPI00265DF5C3|nr:DUF2884 family protein [Fulvimonas sp. R45]MDO1527569.1 DUF2884 family protein [Fulvimonas sp. R45]